MREFDKSDRVCTWTDKFLSARSRSIWTIPLHRSRENKISRVKPEIRSSQASLHHFCFLGKTLLPSYSSTKIPRKDTTSPSRIRTYYLGRVFLHFLRDCVRPHVHVSYHMFLKRWICMIEQNLMMIDSGVLVVGLNSDRGATRAAWCMMLFGDICELRISRCNASGRAAKCQSLIRCKVDVVTPLLHLRQTHRLWKSDGWIAG